MLTVIIQHYKFKIMKKLILILFILLIIISCNKEYQLFKNKYDDALILDLMAVAKKNIMEEFNNKKYDHFVELEYVNSDVGVIVRLLKSGKQRGCISFIKGVSSLEEAVKAASINAAFFDTRFEPLKIDELKYIEIEIGIIGKFKEIKNKMNFQLGTDSLLLEDPLNRTFLQGKIALEEKLNKTEFLNALCEKSGLKKGAYKDKNVKIYKAYTVYLRERFY